MFEAEWPFGRSQNLGLKCQKFGTRFGQSTDCLGGLFYICVFCLMLNNMQFVFGVYEAGNDHGCWFHKVEPMLGEGLPTDSPLLRLGLLKTVCFLVGPKMSMCYLHEFA